MAVAIAKRMVFSIRLFMGVRFIVPFELKEAGGLGGEDIHRGHRGRVPEAASCSMSHRNLHVLTAALRQTAMSHAVPGAVSKAPRSYVNSRTGAVIPAKDLGYVTTCVSVADCAPALLAAPASAGDIQASQHALRRFAIQKSKSLSSGWSSGLRPIGQKKARSVSPTGCSLMLASRLRIRPSGSNSQFSFP